MKRNLQTRRIVRLMNRMVLLTMKLKIPICLKILLVLFTLMGDSQPIPEPVEHPSCRLQSLLMWTLYFLIVWQYCHLISDNALLMLLRFFKAFLVCIGSIIPNGAGADLVLSLAALLPMTMYSLRNFLGIDRDNFERYVVCPKCTKLYRPEDCLRRVGNQVLPVVCDNILFPRSRRRKACGSKLVKKVILKCGTPKY